MSDYALEAYIENIFEVRRKMGNEANIPCPNPAHDGGYNACWVNMETGAFYCFSCHYSGSVAKDSGIDELALMHQQLMKEINDGIEETEPTEDVHQDNSVLARYHVKNHSYWKERNISAETQELFDLGYDAMADAVTMPMRNLEGHLLGVTKRFLAPDVLGSRYKYPKGVKKSQHVFAAHLYGDYDMSTVYITEGAIDAMRIWQVMGPAVAIYGSAISTTQIQIFKKIGVQHVIWFGDGDQAGQRAKERAAGFWPTDGGYKYRPETDLRKSFWFTHVTDHQGKKDAGEMTDRQIVRACNSADVYYPDIKVKSNKEYMPMHYLLEKNRYNS